MQINYSKKAFATLTQLVHYIEASNTQGAGVRWLNRYEQFLEKRLLYPEDIRLCNKSTFNKLGLRCIIFNDWLIAFSIHNSFLLIEAILHRSRIID
jgi:plasmid stabilization system protein ParE